MARRAAEVSAGLATTPVTAYDSTKWNLPSLMKKRTDLGMPFVGPIVPAPMRIFEGSSAASGIFPHVVPWSPDIDWVFTAPNLAAANTRLILLQTFNKATGTWSYQGVITLTFPPATAHTVRGIRAVYEKYTVGTAAVSGTAVTGTGTSWLANRQCVGCRIGFGSTDPTQISTWYEISAIGSETGITLTGSAGSIGDGAYVIEDLRLYVATTNATTTNGGLFVVKGIRYENFVGTAAGTTISAAASTDNVRAVYWLADAASVTNITAAGICLTDKTDWTHQTVYVPDLVSAGNYKVFKYNARAALTLTTGKDTTTLIEATGNNAFTGTGSQLNNGRIGTLNHGPASGVAALYLYSTSRILCAPLSGITAGSTGIIAYTMTEVPPGGVNTFAATAAINGLEIASQMDRLIVLTTGATAFRSYITQFRNDAGQMDHVFLVDDKQLDSSVADGGAVPHGSTQSANTSCWAEAGMLYLVRNTVTLNTNVMIAIPIGADWQYAATTGQRLIAPKMVTPNCSQYYRASAVRDVMLGSVNLGTPTEPIRLYYRTTGIDDNTGAWTAVTDGNDLTGVVGSAAIQFMVEFRVISDTLLPGRVFSIGLQYEDLDTDSHYQPSVTHSDPTAKRFAWRFSVAFGASVPTLYVRLYDVPTGATLLTDNTASPTGTFEKSTDGGSSWVAWTNADKGNETTYLRYTPASLADGIRVRYNLRTA